LNNLYDTKSHKNQYHFEDNIKNLMNKISKGLLWKIKKWLKKKAWEIYMTQNYTKNSIILNITAKTWWTKSQKGF